MTYSLIAAFGDGTWTSPGGQVFPVPGLVEDGHGARLLITPMLVPATAWADAYDSGAEGLLGIAADGTAHFLSTARFLQHRWENRFAAAYECSDQWRPVNADDIGSVYRMAVLLPDATLEANPFVHLHTHSEFSALDGFSTLDEIVTAVTADRQTAAALTDHSVCAGHPAWQAACDEAGIKAIHGIEANFVNDRFARENVGDYWHLVLWAMDDEGLRDLWGLSTEGYREGFYGRPRVDWDTLQRFGGHLMASTACLRGPVLQPFLAGNERAAVMNFAHLADIFGDRLYAELHTNGLEDQKRANAFLIPAAQAVGVPLIAAVDAHYAAPEDKSYHRTWLAMQTASDVADESSLFGGDQNYHVSTAAEVRMALSYLPADVVKTSIANTAAVADRCTAQIVKKRALPRYSRPTAEHPDPAARDVELFMDIQLDAWKSRITDRCTPEEEQACLEAFEYQTPMMIEKGFPGYYLTCMDFVMWAKNNGILVGPGRGSGSASLNAYLMRITELNPVVNKLLFSRFMTPGRMSLPDFDIDFPSSRSDDIIDYVTGKWGAAHVVQVGTHGRVKNKSAFKDVQRAIQSRLPEDSFAVTVKICKIIDEAEASTAGLGLSWDQLFAHVGEMLDPYREHLPELFDIAARVRGRLRQYGRHAAGFIIDPDSDLFAELPMRNGEEGRPMVTQFDMDALEILGKVKYDFLKLRHLDTLQETLDLIEAETGDRIDVYSWGPEEYGDPEVYEGLAAGRTLGVFQIETSLGTRTTKAVRPNAERPAGSPPSTELTGISQLSAVVTLGRPGPMRSGLDKLYMARRFGLEQVEYPDPRLESVLAGTYGAMLYQEDIMAVCRVLAGYDDDEADGVRKILGKKKVEQTEAAGKVFIERAIANDTDPAVATAIWEQMAEFAKYCVTGDTRVMLASSNGRSPGWITAEDLWRKMNAPLLPPVRGRTKVGEEYRGPCVVCGESKVGKRIRGACSACYVWRQKFQDVERGLYGLTVEADGRVRPCRILMVHKLDVVDTWTVTLADGKSITATANHKHLTVDGLRRVDELRVGDKVVVDTGYERHVYTPQETRLTRGDRQLAGAVNGTSGEDNYGYVDGGFAKLMAWTALAPDFCQACGHDGTVHRLERAHLDGDRTHNEPANLRMLCVSCHKRYDYLFNGRQRRWGKGHPTGSSAIVSIEPAGVQQTYSVVMDDPHIWIANDGIATANSFNYAHAFAYSAVTYWTAWFKTHWARQHLVGTMGTIEKDRIPLFVTEARRLGYQVLPPEINSSARGFSADGLTIRYGLESVSGVGEKVADGIIVNRPYVSFQDFWDRRTGVGSDKVKRLVRVGAFEELPDTPHRRALEYRLDDEVSGRAAACVDRDDDVEGAPNNLPCHFDWSSEPIKLGRTNKPLKNQPQPPKKCTKACRHYRPRGHADYESVAPYNDDQVRDIEHETLGTWLSSSPFDRISEEVLAETLSADDLDTAEFPGAYIVCGMVVMARPDSRGRDFGFLTVTTPAGDMDCIVYGREWERYKQFFHRGQLALMEIVKSDQDRYRLSMMEPLVFNVPQMA